MEHRAGYVNIIDLILRGECPVDIRLKMLHFKNNSHAPNLSSLPILKARFLIYESAS